MNEGDGNKIRIIKENKEYPGIRLEAALNENASGHNDSV